MRVGNGREMLPGVSSMKTEFPQRLDYPAGNETEQSVYGTLTNGQRIIGHLPAEIQHGIRAQTSGLMKVGNLSPALRQMIIVRVGYHTNSIYEVEQHRSLAEKVGVPVETLDALAFVDPHGLSVADAAAIAFVDAMITRNAIDDAELAAVACYFGTPEIIEMIFVMGTWWILAKLLVVSGIPVEKERIGDRRLEGVRR